MIKIKGLISSKWFILESFLFLYIIKKSFFWESKSTQKDFVKCSLATFSGIGSFVLALEKA